MEGEDLFQTLLFVEIRLIIRELLPLVDRFKSKSVCRRWKNEDLTFSLPSELMEGLYHSCYDNDKGQWESRRRLFLEWIGVGGLNWKPSIYYAPSGYNSSMRFSLWWNTPKFYDDENLKHVRVNLVGEIPMEVPIFQFKPPDEWIYEKTYVAISCSDNQISLPSVKHRYKLGEPKWTITISSVYDTDSNIDKVGPYTALVRSNTSLVKLLGQNNPKWIKTSWEESSTIFKEAHDFISTIK